MREIYDGVDWIEKLKIVPAPWYFRMFLRIVGKRTNLEDGNISYYWRGRCYIAMKGQWP